MSLINEAKASRQREFYGDNILLECYGGQMYGLDRTPPYFKERTLMDNIVAIRKNAAKEISQAVTRHLTRKAEESTEKATYLLNSIRDSLERHYNVPEDIDRIYNDVLTKIQGQVQDASRREEQSLEQESQNQGRLVISEQDIVDPFSEVTRTQREDTRPQQSFCGRGGRRAQRQRARNTRYQPYSK